MYRPLERDLKIVPKLSTKSGKTPPLPSAEEAELAALREAIARFDAEHDTPEKAGRYLVELGTHDENGDLTPAYGGRPN